MFCVALRSGANLDRETSGSGRQARLTRYLLGECNAREDNHAAGVSDRLTSGGSRGYRSVNATSSELNTGLNIYRMIDFEPV
jgi:hypothetical protein